MSQLTLTGEEARIRGNSYFRRNIEEIHRVRFCECVDKPLGGRADGKEISYR